MTRHILEVEQKALEINLDNGVYGTFAEIGAGQEVARHFFQVGAAAGTIAKTMSAYDKLVSDDIYGLEKHGRYVCESRMYKMLDHEYELMIKRLSGERPETCLFAFADTVSALNYHKTNKGHGWMGLRFQLSPNGEANDMVLHVKMEDNSNILQQQAIGILGVNMVYACYRYKDDPHQMLQSLMDNLEGRVKIDMVRLKGPDFNVDNRLLSLLLVKYKMTEVAMFNAERENVHPSEFLYKKHVLVVRGSFRPATLVNLDMLAASIKQFKAEDHVEEARTHVLTEITLDNLLLEGKLDEQDYLDRVEVLNALGQTVVISNCEEHKRLIRYLSDYQIKNLGIVVGARQLLEVINEKYYQNMDGQLLAAFGELFMRNVRVYVYPALQEGSEELISCTNLPIPDGIKFLYKHLTDSNHLVDIKNFDKKILHIYSKEVLRRLRADETGWEGMVTPKVAKLIKDNCLFGFPCQRMEFEY